MIAMKAIDVEETKVGAIPFKGVTSYAKDVGIRWLSKVGQDAQGAPTYGLRLFTVGPNGEIPTHNHAYEQTMYIVSGQFECWDADPETGKILNKRICGPGDMVYLGTMEPHGMRNVSADDPGQFLCCICTLGT
jgi:uncharacterized RmlC-like cupin family protein